MNVIALILMVLQIPIIYIIKKGVIDKYELFEDEESLGKWLIAIVGYFLCWLVLFLFGITSWGIYTIFDAITK